MRKHTFAFTVIAVLFAASALPAYGYTLLSPKRRWKTTPVTVRVNNAGNATISDSDRGVTAVVGAIRAWGIISSSSTSSSAVRGSWPAIIMLNSSGSVCSSSCLAATLTGYYHQEGSAYYIDDADVYTNQSIQFYSSRESGCSGEYDIDGVMVHEVGHVIGIGHSDVRGATMYPSVGYCDNGPATLHSDDNAAENDLY